MNHRSAIFLFLMSLLPGLTGACAHQEAAGPASRPVSVVTYNLWVWNEERDSSLDLVLEADPDLLVLQEVTKGWRKKLIARLAKRYPYRRMHATGAYGYAIFSKSRLGTASYLGIEGAPPFAQCAPVYFDDATTMLCNLHLISPIRVIVDNKPLGDRLEENEAQRTRQWRKLLDWLSHNAKDLPQIIAGDTNSHGFEDLNDVMAESHVDAHAEAVLWTDATFPNRRVRGALGAWLPEWPFLRLDYVWVSKGIGVVDAEVLAGGGSDHRPVMASLRVQSE